MSSFREYFNEGEKCPGPDEDVRAARPHTVSLTLLVDAEDSGAAVRIIAGAYAGTGIHVERISALPYVPENEW